MSYQTVMPYRSRSSSPASLSPNVFTVGEALHSPPTSSPLAYSCPVEEEGIFPTQMSCPDDFLPPPWDPVAYGQSMTKSMTLGSRRQRIPRPPNAFMLFRSFLLKYRLVERMANHQQNASRVAGLIWRDSALPNRVRLAWHQRADVIRDWHKETFPDYTYTPSRKRLTKVEKDSDEEVDVDTRKKHVKRHLGSMGAMSLPARRHRYLKTVEHESDSDDEYSTCKRRAQHRTPQYPVSLASSRSSRRTVRLEPSASLHPATSMFHLTPPPGAPVTGHRASHAKHIFKLLDMQSYISTELSLAYARMSDAGAVSSSSMPTPLPVELSLAPSPLRLSSIPLCQYVPEYGGAQLAAMGVPVPAPSLSNQVRKRLVRTLSFMLTKCLDVQLKFSTL